MIEVRHLQKTYDNGFQVLKDVNVNIAKGEVVSIIGPSGTGKSTFLRCLNLLEMPSAGEIYFDGVNLLAPTTDINQLRQKVGMVFQHFNLFAHMSVLENLTVGPIRLHNKPKAEATAQAKELLKMVGLAEKANAYPDELSGGQKQRVAIARCLAMEPEIILFDEPTSALDPTMVSEVIGVIRKLAKDGMTMAIVTHEMDFARDVSNRILYMDQGIVYEEGTPQQIFDAPQKERTRDFIDRVKYFTWEITSHDFDFYQLNGELESFCYKHAISSKATYQVLLMTEELLVNLMLPQMAESGLAITLQVRYSENKETLEMRLNWPGAAWNPLEGDYTLDDPYFLPLQMIRSVAQNLDYQYKAEGVNLLSFFLS